MRNRTIETYQSCDYFEVWRITKIQAGQVLETVPTGLCIHENLADRLRDGFVKAALSTPPKGNLQISEIQSTDSEYVK